MKKIKTKRVVNTLQGEQTGTVEITTCIPIPSLEPEERLLLNKKIEEACKTMADSVHGFAVSLKICGVKSAKLQTKKEGKAGKL